MAGVVRLLDHSYSADEERGFGGRDSVCTAVSVAFQRGGGGRGGALDVSRGRKAWLVPRPATRG